MGVTGQFTDSSLIRNEGEAWKKNPNIIFYFIRIP